MAMAALLATGGLKIKEAKAYLDSAEENVKVAKEMYAGQGVDADRKVNHAAETVERVWDAYRKKEREFKEEGAA